MAQGYDEWLSSEVKIRTLSLSCQRHFREKVSIVQGYRNIKLYLHFFLKNTWEDFLLFEYETSFSLN